MSNIEEMEKDIKKFGVSINNHEGWLLSGILENILNSLKDLHEENTKLWKAIKEGGWNDSDAPVLSKKDLENLVPDYEYPYEPNE
jgi:hypothetical protein